MILRQFRNDESLTGSLLDANMLQQFAVGFHPSVARALGVIKKHQPNRRSVNVTVTSIERWPAAQDRPRWYSS